MSVNTEMSLAFSQEKAYDLPGGRRLLGPLGPETSGEPCAESSYSWAHLPGGSL
jgi:hypothetical protein